MLINSSDGTFTFAKIRKPSDFHAHVRADDMMRAIVRHLIYRLKYLLVMPNTGPIRTIDDALRYRTAIMQLAAEAGNPDLQLIMTLYHTTELTPEVIRRMADEKIPIEVKHYPPEPGMTTGSGQGIPLEDSDYQLRAMEEHGIPLLGHFESKHDKNGRELPPEERESYYVVNKLYRIRDKYPDLKICGEHGSTKEMVEFAKQDTSGKTAITITPQHLLFVDEDLVRRSWGNHLRCMPIPKNWKHREAVREFVFSGDSRAIAGSDSAPHPAKKKAGSLDQAANGCFTPHAVALYAKAFMDGGAFDERFERFVSINGAVWRGLPLPTEDDLVTIRVENETDIPDPVPVPEIDDVVIPLGWTTGEDKLKIGLVLD